MDNEDRLKKTGPSRRDVVVLAAGAGAAMALTPSIPAPSPNMAQSPAKPVAFVWMGQVMLDSTGQETPYVPPSGYGRPTIGT